MIGQRVQFRVPNRKRPIRGTLVAVLGKKVRVEQDPPKGSDPYLYRTRVWTVDRLNVERI